MLAKQKLWAKDAPVPCQIIEGDNAVEISLAENALQCPMHPADQFEAFAKLHGEGMSVEDIAARFGVSPRIVMQRLKLGAVSPALMEEYRNGEMNLEQLSAFAITDDHALQERVWNELGYDDSRHAILEALNDGQVAADDRRARYIGEGAYLAAGGSIIRDLFDEEGGGFFNDAALLNRLVTERLALEAEKVSAEGWKWVEVAIAFDYGIASGMRRIYPMTRELTEAEDNQIHELSLRYEALCDEEEEYLPEAFQKMLADIDREIDAIRGEVTYRQEDRSIAGVFVTIGHDGELRIERGFVKREDDPKRGAGLGEEGGEKDRAPKGELPAKLVEELTAHRTAALANELAQKPDLALVAVTHALAAQSLYMNARGFSCLDINSREIELSRHATDIGESTAMRQIRERQTAWEWRVPESAADLWVFVIGLAERAEKLLVGKGR